MITGCIVRKMLSRAQVPEFFPDLLVRSCIYEFDSIRCFMSHFFTSSAFFCGVNALNRANSISTVSLYSPVKSRLPSLISAGNCQNILIITIFRHFFCLFENGTSFIIIFSLTNNNIVSQRHCSFNSQLTKTSKLNKKKQMRPPAQI